MFVELASATLWSVIDLRVTIDGDPPTGTVVRERDDARSAFVGWGGLLRAITELAGEQARGAEPLRS